MNKKNTNGVGKRDKAQNIDEILLLLCEKYDITLNDPLVYQKISMKLYEIKNYQLAKRICNKALESNPDSAVLHVILSDIFLAINDLESCKREARIAYNLMPNFPESLGCYGNSLIIDGKIDEGITFLERALVLRPDMYGIHRNLGIVYAQKKDHPNAILHLKEMYRLHKTMRNWLNIKIYLAITNGIFQTIGMASVILLTLGIVFKNLVLLIIGAFFILLILMTGIFVKTNKDY